MAKGFFVTGTDTGIGKSWVSAGLLRAFADQGHRSVGMKPIASGCEQTPDGLRNEDALLLQQAGNLDLPYDAINSYGFEPAIAPHIAADEAGVKIDFERIAEGYQALAAQADRVVVEGVGGWLVPLQGVQTVADLAQRLALPVILVVGMRLGCINHALLTAEAIDNSGLTLVGWVANRVEPDMARFEENLQTLTELIDAPLLGTVSYMTTYDEKEVGASLDMSVL